MMCRCATTLESRDLPTFPGIGKNEGRIVLDPNGIRDFATDDLLPFVESVSWDQAAPFLECLPIRGRRITVSTRALMVLYAILGSFAQYDLRTFCQKGVPCAPGDTRIPAAGLDATTILNPQRELTRKR
jgi:hypothetical protein